MAAVVELVLPGLFDLPETELEAGFLARELPWLNRVLRHASARPNSAFSIDAILRQSLRIDSAPGQENAGLPLAQALTDGDPPDPGRWMVFQAVHLHPDLRSAIVHPIPKIANFTEDIGNIINDLSDLFKVDCDISALSDEQFLIRLKQIDAPDFYPHLLSMLGKSADPYMAQSRDMLPWYRLLNEMQMFMHQHVVNEERQRRGLATVNSLWFWGGGAAPPATERRLAFYSDDVLLSRFAASLGVDTAALAEIGNADSTQDLLALDLRLLEWLKNGLDEPLQELLLDMDARLFKPMLEMAAAGGRVFRLRSAHRFDLELSRFAGFRFWRRARSLAMMLGQS